MEFPVGMTEGIEEFMKRAPSHVRERLMSMDPAQRERLLERRRKMLGSTDDKTHEAMRQTLAHMRQRAPAPEIGSEGPDFDLAVLDGGDERVRLADLRGNPVGLVFGSFT